MREDWVYRRTAQFHETDQMGIIHHSNYIKWMEEARIYLMDKMGYSYRDMDDKGIYSPVLDVTCRYVKSVQFNDKIRILVSLKSMSRVRFVLQYKMYNDSMDGILCTESTSTHCFYRKDGSPRPLDLKQELGAFFEKFPTEEEL